MQKEYKERDLHAEYGNFITQFEQICYFMRVAVRYLLFGDRHDEEVRILNDIVLADVTADTLAKKLWALYAFRNPAPTESKKLMKKFINVFQQDIVPIRNSLSHGFVSYEYDSENPQKLGTPGVFSLTHPRLKGPPGFDKGHRLLTIENLEKLNIYLNTIGGCITHLVATLRSENSFSDEMGKKILEYLNDVQFKLVDVKLKDMQEEL